MPGPASSHQIVSAYRDLYRTALHAVRYARPARYVIRDRLRRAFREAPAEDFEPARIANTLRFLEAAGADRGLEHRVLKTLCHVWWAEQEQWSRRRLVLQMHQKGGATAEVQDAVVRGYDQFYEMLRLLNQSMGMCLR